MKNHSNTQRTILRTILLLAALMPGAVWGQTGTDCSGIYYFVNGGSGKTDLGDPALANVSNPDDYFYLVPADNPQQTNKRDAWYSSDYSTTNGDPEKPYLTTYRTNKDVAAIPDGVTNRPHNSVWIVQFASTDGGTDYYYLIHAATGKYVVYEPPYSNKNNRKSVHLLTTDSPGENAKFAITISSGNYNFRPKSLTSGYRFLNAANANYNYYYSSDGYADGDANYFRGLVGLWSAVGGGSDWQKEETLLDAPTISDVDANNRVTIADANSLPSGYKIRYTTDGSVPTASTGREYSGAIPITESVTINAVVVRYGMVLTEVASETREPAPCAKPVISFDYTNSMVSITCATDNTTIYYTTNGDTPTTNSTEYSSSFLVTSTTAVKAIATHATWEVSDVAELTISQVATPTIQNNGSNAISIMTTTPGATIYYTTDGTTPSTSSTSSSEYTGPLTDNVSNVTIKAIAVKENMITSAVGSGSVKLQCATPVIARDGMTFTLSCSKPTDAALYYTLGSGSEVAYTGTPVSFTSDQLPITVTAWATHNDYTTSAIASREISNGDGSPSDPYQIYNTTDLAKFVTDVNNGTTSSACYKLMADLSASGIGEITTTFSGTFEAAIDPATHMPYRITNLSAPLFTTLTGTVRNLVIESVAITSGDASGNTGAIACTANGTARIYNVGILSGSVGGTGYTGGLVGLLDHNGTDDGARVINCYSYATITGGSDVGGIVGYNNYASTASDIRTMVMNCMFYGDITGGTTVSPVYGGTNIANLQGGLNTFNYYAYDQLPTSHITSGKYNSTLAVEEKYLNRFEFYRLLLNSNKKLAAFYASTTTTTVAPGDMLKWVLETADRTIDNPKPYPVLKAQGYYPSIINPDFDNAPDSSAVGRNHGGKLGKTLSVTISSTKTDGGQTWPTGAAITQATPLTLIRTDKDFDRFNFNYDKVQLPYYNDVGEGNYTGNKVVTGWKIISMSPTPTSDPYTASNYPTSGITDYPNHNYADRKSVNKDLYSVSKRVFSQGAYFDVPYGVTSITIEPYWGNAIYVADQYYDVVYKNDYSGKQGVSQTGTQTVDNTTQFNGQKVRTSITDLGAGTTVYDNAVVLVGNFHLDSVPSGGTTPFTMMSVDEDNDHEPDYSLIYHHKGRTGIAPIRFDFLNIPGTAQAQKPNDASLICNFTIFKTKGWFECTNTAFFYTSQVEYENLNSISKSDAPLILLGGVIDQFVSTQSDTVTGKTIYIHVGGNVWINSFGLGTHSDGSKSTPHVPVSVTGGEYPGFYLTGTYNANANIRNDNAECYISGGYFHEAAGAAQEAINGDVRWQIYNADIDNFYGGGTNDAKPIKGDVTVDIYNSHVDTYCGGPKFGNMQTGKKVKTNAEGCVFGKFFGAGFGGLSYSRKKYYDKDDNPVDWSNKQTYYTTDRGKYFDGATTNSRDGGSGNNQYGKKGVGVATDFDYEYFVWSSGKTGGRFFVKFASFSLAQCNDVESKLKNCTIDSNFYGGGNLGKVIGNITSELDGCTVKGNVFGAGYSASLPTLQVRDAGFTVNPKYNSESGMFEPGVFSGTTEFTWKNAAEAGVTLSDGGSGSDLNNHYIYTNTTLNNLGTVQSATLTLKGNTVVGTMENGTLQENTGNVYGGGDESAVVGNTSVILSGNTEAFGNVYGGGNKGPVGGNSSVTLQ